MAARYENAQSVVKTVCWVQKLPSEALLQEHAWSCTEGVSFQSCSELRSAETLASNCSIPFSLAGHLNLLPFPVFLSVLTELSHELLQLLQTAAFNGNLCDAVNGHHWVCDHAAHALFVNCRLHTTGDLRTDLLRNNRWVLWTFC